MPNIEQIPELFHQPLDPYHHHYDNLPLKNILARQEIINTAVDQITTIITEAAGTQGSISNRLDQFSDEDGNLLESSVNEIYHGISYHEDDAGTLSDDEIDAFAELGYTLENPVNFVRMLEVERNKLALVADEATALQLQVETISNTVSFINETAILVESDTVTWTVSESNQIQANLAFPSEAAHSHYYDVTPVTEDYTEWTTTSINTAYIAETLRVYINGVRVPRDTPTYIPSATDPTDTWTLTSFSEDDPSTGTFSMSRELSSEDIVRIDFDIQYD